MISDYFEHPHALKRMRSGCMAPHLDGFAAALAVQGYTPHTLRGYIRAAVHVGRWADRRGVALGAFDDATTRRFAAHLSRCGCGFPNKGLFGDALAGVEHLLVYLRAQGFVAPAAIPVVPPRAFAALMVPFAEWMLRHRGVVPGTAHRYQVALRPFLEKLGEDPSKFDVAGIRRFVIEYLGERGRGEARSTVKGLRAFLGAPLVGGGLERS